MAIFKFILVLYGAFKLREFLGLENSIGFNLLIIIILGAIVVEGLVTSLTSGDKRFDKENIKTLREVRAATGMSLKEAKKFLENEESQQGIKKQKAKPKAQTLKMYGSGPVAIDGANLWGRVYSDTHEDHQKAFEAVANLLVRLKASGYDPHVFWDSKFHRLATHLQLAGLSEGLPNMLSELLTIEKQMITVSQRGLAADADIIAWATLKKAAIISNDNFNKEIEDEIILSRASSLKERGLLKKFSHSAGDIVVPGLTNLV